MCTYFTITRGLGDPYHRIYNNNKDHTAISREAIEGSGKMLVYWKLIIPSFS